MLYIFNYLFLSKIQMVCLWDIRKSGNTKFFAGKFPADVSKLSVLNDSLVICSGMIV